MTINTPEDLFEHITKIVAHPHTTITKMDREKAAKIISAFGNYLIEHPQDQEDI